MRLGPPARVVLPFTPICSLRSQVLQDHTEVWAGFYDILVRHAFGSYSDILREGMPGIFTSQLSAA